VSGHGALQGGRSAAGMRGSNDRRWVNNADLRNAEDHLTLRRNGVYSLTIIGFITLCLKTKHVTTFSVFS